MTKAKRPIAKRLPSKPSALILVALSIIEFSTESGSKYEVDFQQKKARRLSGSKPPTDRQGVDGEWRMYNDVCFIAPTGQVAFEWRRTPDDVSDTTLTSPVVDADRDAVMAAVPL